MAPAAYDDDGLDRFRSYLHWLARRQLRDRPAARAEASDLVQQTLLKAHRDRAAFRGTTDAERAAWLRRILARTLADAVRAGTRAKRDIARERSIDADLTASSIRLGNWLAAEQSSPSHRAARHEQAVRLAEALSRLPEAQREALVLQHWHGYTLDQIGAHLGRTPTAVAGLLKRGLRALRTQLAEASGGA